MIALGSGLANRPFFHPILAAVRSHVFPTSGNWQSLNCQHPARMWYNHGVKNKKRKPNPEPKPPPPEPVQAALDGGFAHGAGQ